MDIYQLDPPPDVTLKDITDLLVFIQPCIDEKAFMAAPENIKRLFKPSVYSTAFSSALN